ncbi:putative transposase, fragment [Aromatoleum aromaticum EbN1]|uniref:Transposase n=1 Tax=Aromatoleum aromaticum (strain DSM 19018 / LMG 30748 / EbN1) TaxID=76114 RepID=Q5P185_AROAE|nr:putative transposase, fragment [Aromatoleum aromaticum EbN1]
MIAPRPVSAQGGRPPYPTETMVRILVLKRLYNLSDEQMEYQLLDRMSYKRFCGLANATNVPDRTTVWTFENRIGEAGAKALFDGVSAQLLKKGFIARGGQIIDATLVPAPKQHNRRGEKELIEQGAMPALWRRRSGATRISMRPGPGSTARAISATSCRSTSTRNTRSSADSRLTLPPCTTASTSATSSTRATRAAMFMPTGATRPSSVKPG